MLITDLDGTLLDSQGRVSDRNRQAIERARDVQIEVVFATGRSWLECRSIAQSVLGEGRIITAGGAALHDIASGRCEDRITISHDLVQHCTESLLAHGHLAHLLKDASLSGYDYLLVGDREIDAASRWWFEIHSVQTRSIAALPTDGIERHAQLQHVLRVGTVAHKAELKDVTAALLREVPEKLSIKHWPALVSAGKPGTDTHLLEIFDAAVDKWTMVQRLCRARGMDEGLVATIGDGLNDIGMLQGSRLSFAVANAMPNVAEHATERAPCNDSDAIAWVVDRLMRDA
jgi:HAD superfamily hydrolase (TIGR01484 family)